MAIGMISFSVLFPDLAEHETRVVHIMREGGTGEPGSTLPLGKYAFLEFFCVDPRCDCRRAILNVQDLASGKILAAISYGFDRDEPEAGPFLDPINEQSEHARDLLDLAKNVVLADLDYAKRLERHYQLVKAAISDPAHPIHGRLPAPRSEGQEAFEAIKAMALTSTKIGRNDPCYCESGKKYKRCCLLAPTTSWAV